MDAKHDPRANQKERTRAAIVEAAARLMKDGAAPSVAAAAAAAKVSRATAYRYFPTPEALHLEVAGVTPAFAPLERVVESLEGEDAKARTLLLMDAWNAATFADEAQMRMALKVYLETWFSGGRDDSAVATVREGRRMRWLARALEPARLTGAQQRRLKAALALAGGVEALVVMKDVCRLDDAEAQEVLRWVATVLLEAGLAESADRAKGTRR